MKQIVVLALVLSAAASVFARPNVDVSIGIGQPGVYGRIDIGNYPAPAVVYPQPLVVAPTPVAVYRQPIYVYVPVPYQQNWGRYCGRYGACGQPVYFVHEQWVQERYRVEHEGEHGGRRHVDDHQDHDHPCHEGHERQHDHND